MNAFRTSSSKRPIRRSAERPSYGASARPRFGGDRGGRSGGRSDRQEIAQKFDAVCSACGKACQVPFRPNGKKPVYCKDCFDAPRKSLPAGAKSFAPRESESGVGGGGKTIADLTRQIAAMNAKIDTMLEIVQGDGE